MTRPRVFFYVQHLLGIGHLTRAMTLARAMRARGLAVTVVSGGDPVPVVAADGLDFVQLPPARAADRSFKLLHDGAGEAVDDAWKARRRDLLRETFLARDPQVLIIELFPFGRRQMRFELIPLLEAARRRPRPVAVACSVRDILVAKERPERNDEMVALALRYVDAVLVHGDPDLVPFEASFPHARALGGGSATPATWSTRTAWGRPPAGRGGRSGVGRRRRRGRRTAADGARLPPAHPNGRRALANPRRPQHAGGSLPGAGGRRVRRGDGGTGAARLRGPAQGCRRLHLPGRLQHGDGSARHRHPRRHRPYAGGEENEQTIRGGLLAERGLVRMLAEDALTVGRLAGRWTRPSTWRRRGVRGSAWTGPAGRPTWWPTWPRIDATSGNDTVHGARRQEATRVWSGLIEELDAWAAAGRVATFWWRDDDATHDGAALRHLLALAEDMEVPLALAVIPAAVDEGVAPLVAGHRRVRVLQHGFAHRNHAAPAEKRCEFPAARDPAAAAAELTRGRQRLTDLFGPRFLAALVPPWNRIAADLVARLPEAGLTALSTYGARASSHAAPGVRRTNCHADIVDWRGGRRFLGASVVLDAVVSHLRARRRGRADPDEPTGLLTHHKDHDPGAGRSCAVPGLRPGPPGRPLAGRGDGPVGEPVSEYGYPFEVIRADYARAAVGIGFGLIPWLRPGRPWRWPQSSSASPSCSPPTPSPPTAGTAPASWSATRR